MDPKGLVKKGVKLAGKKKYSALLAKYWPYLLAAVIAIALIILVIWLIRRRRRQRAGAGAEPTAVARPALELKRAWKRFLKEIPGEYRRSVVLYQPYIVLGAAGSGKSSLIDRCTDWRGQAAQFHPSYTDDPLVQFYQGSGVVVQELSVAVLGDVSPEARRALRALWKPLRRNTKTPEVVVVLDAAGMQSDPPDVLAKHAQLVRGKINVLSQLLGRPVSTSIALTHLDQIEGYRELSAYLQQHGRTPLIELAGTELSRCLEGYEDELPFALTTQPAGAYLKIAAFLARSPELLTPLSAFVQVLQTPDPTTKTPQLTTLSLSSTADGEQSANPLQAAITAADVSGYRPQRKHRWAAAGIAAAGLCFLGGAFLREGAVIGEASRRADRLTADGDALYPASARRRFFDYVDTQRDRLLSKLLPTFHVAHATFYKQAIYRRYIDGLRRRVIYPRLEAAAAGQDADREWRVLHFLALIHGTKDNALGKKILAERDRWETALGLPGALIADYLAHNPRAGFETPFDLRRFDRTFKLAANADYGSAALFFEQLGRAQQGPLVDRQTLVQLQSKARALLVDVADVDRNREVLALLDLLEQEAGITLAKQWRQRIGKLPKMDSATMKQLVDALTTTKLVHPPAASLTLDTLIDAVKELASARDTIKLQLAFAVEGKIHEFASERWHATVRRSRIVLLLRAFEREKESDALDVFFAPDQEYAGLSLARQGGGGFFAGDAQINGVFTRAAFDERVKPALLQLPQFFEKLDVPKADHDELLRFVSRSTADYADRYVAQYRQYYRAFDYRAPNLAALQYILSQLQLPSSPLKRFLGDVAKNVALELEDKAAAKHLEPLRKIPTTFAFLSAVVETPKGGVSGIEGFGVMMGKLHGQLTSNAPFVVTDEQDAANALKARLTPVGRVALSIFRDDDDSEMKAVETWLLSANIGADWQRPFLGPVRAAYRLGLAELNRTVDTTWGNLYAERLAPLVRGFPLARQAEGDVTPEQIENALHPDKHFATTFRDFVAPLLRARQQQWIPRTSRFTAVDLPRGMLPLVNAMAELGRELWDADKNPRALPLRLKPLPLPLTRVDQQAVVLAYLQVGEDTVYAFNQQPAWKELPLKWWKVETATVGAVYTKEAAKEPKKVYRNTTVAEAPWSFLRLMLSATETERQPNLWNWKVPGPEGRGGVTVQFRSDRDPWETFRALRDKIEGARPSDAR